MTDVLYSVVKPSRVTLARTVPCKEAEEESQSGGQVGPDVDRVRRADGQWLVGRGVRPAGGLLVSA